MRSLFCPRLYRSLPAAPAARRCRRLYLMFDKLPQDVDPQLLKLTKLRELGLHGSIAQPTVELPAEIGQFQTLRKLTLLNVEISTFPAWISKLQNLRYLMVRGTDFTHLPDTIAQLTNLRTLRIENCNLQALPATLPQLTKLRHLGLTHTPLLPNLSAWQLPPQLKSLNVLGSGGGYPREGQYTREELRALRRALGDVRVRPDPESKTFWKG